MVGCDDSMFAKCYNPSISSIATDKQLVGSLAFSKILAQTTDHGFENSTPDVDIVIRESTEKCRKK